MLGTAPLSAIATVLCLGWDCQDTRKRTLKHPSVLSEPLATCPCGPYWIFEDVFMTSNLTDIRCYEWGWRVTWYQFIVYMKWFGNGSSESSKPEAWSLKPEAWSLRCKACSMSYPAYSTRIVNLVCITPSLTSINFWYRTINYVNLRLL